MDKIKIVTQEREEQEGVDSLSEDGFETDADFDSSLEAEADVDVDTDIDMDTGGDIDSDGEGEEHSGMLPAVRKDWPVEVYRAGAGKSKELVKSDRSDPLVRYMREISKYKLLSPERERALTKALAETGDIEVAKELVQANLRLVVKIAMEYRYAYHNLMDLIQEGNIGLMKAVSKFDSNKGAKLSYYASWWIRSYILKFILDNFRLVRIGTTSDQKKLFYNLLREKERLLSLGIGPDTKMISDSLGVSEKSVEVMNQRLGSHGSELSIDRPISDGEGKQTSLLDTLADGSEPIEDTIADAQGLEILKHHLKDFVNTLKDRDRIIFEKRLLSEVPPSLQSIADEYGVSRERIRQVEERLLKKLKVYMSEFIR
ncbi:MAG: RNA polymerase factor sigma-32 [Oligoflexia bacterium]|nr:RNA polymerase factor sigma-32 [Oligoflexia bacterium]